MTDVCSCQTMLASLLGCPPPPPARTKGMGSTSCCLTAPPFCNNNCSSTPPSCSDFDKPDSVVFARRLSLSERCYQVADCVLQLAHGRAHLAQLALTLQIAMSEGPNEVHKLPAGDHHQQAFVCHVGPSPEHLSTLLCGVTTELTDTQAMGEHGRPRLTDVSQETLRLQNLNRKLLICDCCYKGRHYKPKTMLSWLFFFFWLGRGGSQGVRQEWSSVLDIRPLYKQQCPV